MTDITQRLRAYADESTPSLILDAELHEAADEIDAQRELLRAVRAERDDLAGEVYRLRADIHSCHPGCTRAGCVNERLRAALEELMYARTDKAEAMARAALGE